MGVVSGGRDVYETGNEPEFLIEDFARYEDAGNGMVRVYVASRRGNLNRVEYAFICCPETLARLGRTALLIAAEAHHWVGFVGDMTH